MLESDSGGKKPSDTDWATLFVATIPTTAHSKAGRLEVRNYFNEELQAKNAKLQHQNVVLGQQNEKVGHLCAKYSRELKGLEIKHNQLKEESAQLMKDKKSLHSLYLPMVTTLVALLALVGIDHIKMQREMRKFNRQLKDASKFGPVEDEIERYNQHLSLDPFNTYALTERAKAFMKMERYSEAHIDFKTVSDLRPTQEALGNTGESAYYFALEQSNHSGMRSEFLRKAKKAYEKAFRRLSDSEQDQFNDPAKHRTLFGRVHAELGNTTYAIEQLEKAAWIDRTNVEICIEISNLYGQSAINWHWDEAEAKNRLQKGREWLEESEHRKRQHAENQ